ncbi:MAG: alpha/beta hydrolase [Anaerolineales bacterium]|nr:alpha/beta hydrolase [Anaerolineales bacterium]
MMTRYLTVSGGTLAYDEAGAGPLVIGVPGLGDLRAEYRFLTPQLTAAGFRVVTLDLRGHGESGARWAEYSMAAVGADVLALMRHLKAGPAILVGTSFGAGAAVYAAAEAPELTAGLVLLGPAVRDGGPKWLERILYTAMFADPWGVAMWAWYFPKLFPTRRPADFEPYLAALRANLSEPGRLAALRGLINASKLASAERLGRVKAPALVVMGDRDPDFKDPAAEARRVAEPLGAEVAMVPGAGHYPHVEMPEITGPRVLAFLRAQAVRA